ncbi:MAG TPA: FAD-binding oxidoreductase [Anaerolineales bacterium]|nr:FAD-binding oxidoreductase [Anaerolineales bacterium]
MSIEAHDVVIIGGGIIGLSTAYYLAKSGLDVCILEKQGVALGSSGRCAGGIGQSHREPPDLPIARFAVQQWQAISADMDIDIQYRQHSNLRLAMNEAHMANLLAMVEREQQGGLDVRFVDRPEVKRRVPFVSDIYLGAVLSPTDGSADPYRACSALARAAARLGVVIHQPREVTGLQVSQGKIQGVLTNEGPVASRQVLIAAGAWAASIGQMAGVKIPATNMRSHLLVTERLPHFIDPFLSTDIYGYFRQTMTGNVLIGFPARPLLTSDMSVTHQAVAVAARRAVDIIPCLRDTAMLRGFTGHTVWTPDYLPVVGPVPDIDGLYVAAAFCGLGFAIGPGIGRLVAELIATGQPSLPIDMYRLERFAQSPA